MMSKPHCLVAGSRAKEIFDEDREDLYIRVDRLFGGLMIFQYVAAVIVAYFVSPRTWSGEYSSLHPHFWTATILGGIISFFPVLLIHFRPGHVATRHVVAVSQMLMGALLIHLSGGRIETHFHVFGSLAFLAFYRDWRVLLSATVIVAADHFLRGIYWPQSVFGVLTASHWRWLEHAAWVVFIDIFLISSCRRTSLEMSDSAVRMAELEHTNQLIDAKVKERTAELARHKEHLEEIVEERTVEVRRAMDNLSVINDELTQANKHKSQFLSTMSHELRTPMNAIIGFTDLLLSEGFGPLNDKQKDYLKRVEGSGEHLLALINDVLDVARIDAGAVELSPERLRVDDIVRSTLSMLAAQFKKKNIRYDINVAADIPDIEVDKRKFRQIVINLVGNALKYSPENGVITVSAVLQNASEVVISVADTGVGIAPEQIDRIFEEFHQADRRRDETLGGIGLGLALTRRLVELHGGTIRAESVVGEGSTFFFTVPAAADATPVRSEESPVSSGTAPAELDHESQLILVAEDNDANLAMIQNMLALRKYRVVVARDGIECLERLKEARPALILTDVRMPRMDGLEATRAIRANPALDGVPIIALTANASAVSEQECIDAGCDAHLTKPVKINQLFVALDRYLPAGSAALPR